MPGPKGEPIGSFTTNPVEIDAIIRNDYDPIYHGNIEDLEEHASSFIKKFLPFLFQDTEFQVDPIEGPLLMELCTHGPFSSGGMDGWAPQDWSILPLQAFIWLAHLLNTIESGASWPRGTLHGKSSFLRKDPSNPSLKSTDFRVLLLLSILYRRWASYRLFSLQPWIAKWVLDEMYAGIPGRCAEDAWWISSFLLENAHLAGIPFSGGAVDIFKCFD